MSYEIPEVIAQLDVLEQEILRMAGKVREFRHTLFETLDNDPDELVD